MVCHVPIHCDITQFAIALANRGHTNEMKKRSHGSSAPTVSLSVPHLSQPLMTPSFAQIISSKLSFQREKRAVHDFMIDKTSARELQFISLLLRQRFLLRLLNSGVSTWHRNDRKHQLNDFNATHVERPSGKNEIQYQSSIIEWEMAILFILIAQLTSHLICAWPQCTQCNGVHIAFKLDSIALFFANVWHRFHSTWIRSFAAAPTQYRRHYLCTKSATVERTQNIWAQNTISDWEWVSADTRISRCAVKMRCDGVAHIVHTHIRETGEIQLVSKILYINSNWLHTLPMKSYCGQCIRLHCHLIAKLLFQLTFIQISHRSHWFRHGFARLGKSATQFMGWCDVTETPGQMWPKPISMLQTKHSGGDERAEKKNRNAFAQKSIRRKQQLPLLPLDAIQCAPWMPCISIAQAHKRTTTSTPSA